MKILSFLIVSSFSWSIWATAVLIEDGTGRSVVEDVAETEFTSFDDVFALQAKRRLAVGASFGGPSGFIGVNTDLHYMADNSVRISLGGGPGYQSFGIAWRWLPMDTEVHPVIGFGFTDWFGSLGGNRADPGPPPFLSESVLSGGDRQAGRFNHFFYVPTVGVQWTQLSGPGVGSSLFLELNLLIHASSLQLFTSANAGVSYAF